MTRVLVTMAEGFEEIEALTIVDVLRRGGVEVVMAALGELAVKGAHGIVVMADAALKDVTGQPFDALVLPGGGPGAARLRDDVRVQALIKSYYSAGKLVAAICAAPQALQAAGVLKGKRVTAYPGTDVSSGHFVEEPVVEDGHLITSRGPATAIAFALALVRRLAGATIADKLAQGMLVPR